MRVPALKGKIPFSASQRPSSLLLSALGAMNPVSCTLTCTLNRHTDRVLEILDSTVPMSTGFSGSSELEVQIPLMIMNFFAEHCTADVKAYIRTVVFPPTKVGAPTHGTSLPARLLRFNVMASGQQPLKTIIILVP